MASITLLGCERSGKRVIVIYREHASEATRQMLAGDMLRRADLVEELSDVDLATVGRLFGMEYGAVNE